MRADYLQFLLLNSIIEHIREEQNKVELVIQTLESECQLDLNKGRTKLFMLLKLLTSARNYIFPLLLTFQQLRDTKPFISKNLSPYFDDLCMGAEELNIKASIQQLEVTNLMAFYNA